MNNMNLKINTFNSNNYTRAVEHNRSKKKVDTFAKLIKLGLASTTSVSEHFIWQTYNLIFDNISKSKLSDGQLVSILPTISDAVKAYIDRIEEAVHYELIEDPNGSYQKSLK